MQRTAATTKNSAFHTMDALFFMFNSLKFLLKSSMAREVRVSPMRFFCTK